MHEASIAQSLIDAVQASINDGKLSGKVKTIYLKVGKLTAVVPDYLTFMFSVLAEGGPLQGVKVQVQDVAVRGACSACGWEDVIDEPKFLCPRCDSGELQILSGRELLIEAVEVE
jgi:hydrogenase nickel incorporation protein HypA/HybF